MEYINASSISKEDSGGLAELEVWERLKQAFSPEENGVLYHQYPIIEKDGQRFDRKPDFVLLHEELGLLVIECKGYQIKHIDYIEGETWHLRKTRYDTASPKAQAQKQGLYLQRFLKQEPILRERCHSKIPMNVFVALPNISREEWQRREFDGPAAPRVILSDDLTPVALREQLSNVVTFDPLTSEEYDVARDVLSCGQPISGTSRSPAPAPTTAAEHYEQVKQGLEGLNTNQQKIGMRIPDGPQQIRGIAGSGKTVLLAMKAARMLSEYEDWRIAMTFSTKSLYQHITSLVERFYEHLTGETLDEATGTIDIIHGWGGKTTGPGMYQLVASNTPDVTALSVDEAGEQFGWDTDLQEAVARDVRQTGDIPTIWDAVLIDEAQDFGPEFFNMCLEALDENDRLIWAYDEAQDLGSLTAPSPKNIFGTDDTGKPVVDLIGSYKNGIQKSHIMRKSYRAPREVLMTAHVLGMGLKRSEGPIQTITRQDGWENIGYQIEGDFRKIGSNATLSRPLENSPHPLNDTPEAAPFVRCERFTSKRPELEWVADQIEADITDEGLSPEQILVIPLGPNARGHGHYILREELDDRGIEINCVWAGDDKVFTEEGQVTVSQINRAKGNEAASVYVVGFEEVMNENYRENIVRRRNEAFVAITRSRAWCTITGTEDGAEILDEFERILGALQKADPSVTFDVPDVQDLANQLEEDTENIQDTNITDFV